MDWDETEMNEKITHYLKTGEGEDYVMSKVLELATYISKLPSFNGNSDRDDLIQWAMLRVFRKLHKWESTRGKSYSFVYKVIYMEFLYRLRERARKWKNRNEYETSLINTVELYYEEEQFSGVPSVTDAALDEVEALLKSERRVHIKSIEGKLEQLSILRECLRDGWIDLGRTGEVRKYIKKNKHLFNTLVFFQQNQ